MSAQGVVFWLSGLPKVGTIPVTSISHFLKYLDYLTVYYIEMSNHQPERNESMP